MSDSPTALGGVTPTGGGQHLVQEVDMTVPDPTPPEGGSEFKAITSQADLDRIVGGRVAREREKYADYDELKTKAAEFDKAAEANKTELQKAIDRAAAAEQKAAAFEAKEQRAKWAEEIVKDSDVPAIALRGATREELVEHFEQLKPHFAKEKPTRRATPGGRSDSADLETGKARAAAALRGLRRE